MLKFDTIDNIYQIRKKLKISSELLTQKALADLQKFKPKITKNFKIEEKPISDFNDDDVENEKKEEEEDKDNKLKNHGDESPEKAQTPTFQ